MRPGVVAPCHLRGGGYSIIELMVALAIGLLIALAAGALLLSSRAAYSLQAEQARVEEAGRFALEHIARLVRQSAYRSAAEPVEATRAAFIGGLDSHTMKDVDAALEAALPVARNGSDILALYFSGGGAGGAADGSALNCAGLRASGDAADANGASIFYVAADAGGEPELRCKYRGASSWNSDALVRGVDAMQVLYGVDTDADGLPNRFVNASAIEAHDAALPLSGASAAEQASDRRRKTLWKNVVALKLALLLRGAQNVAAGGRRYELFGPQYTAAVSAATDGVALADDDFAPALRRRYRQVFGTTITLRNR